MSIQFLISIFKDAKSKTDVNRKTRKPAEDIRRNACLPCPVWVGSLGSGGHLSDIGTNRQHRADCYYVINEVTVGRILFCLLAGYLQDGCSGIPSQPRGPVDISPEIDPSSLPVPV